MASRLGSSFVRAARPLATQTVKRNFSAKPPPSLGAQLKPEVQENIAGWYPESAFAPPAPELYSPSALKEALRQQEPKFKIPSATVDNVHQQQQQQQQQHVPLEPTNDEVVAKLLKGDLALKHLDTVITDPYRAVCVRRMYYERLGEAKAPSLLKDLPFQHYDYSLVEGACGENVIGYVPIPVGLAGPMLLDGRTVHFPMATTEGCLIASTSRGCRAITDAGGAQTVLVNSGITRAPVVRFSSALKVCF